MRERQNERQREKKEEIVRQKLTEGRGRQKVGWSTSEREKQKETERGRWEKMDIVKEIQRQKQGNRMRLQCRQRTKMGRDWMEDAGCELHCGVTWALLPTPVSCPSDSPVCTLQISLPQCYKRNAWRNRGQEQHLNGQEQSWV